MTDKPAAPVVNIADAKLEEQGHGDKFLVRRARMAPQLGLKNIGCSIQIIPPGKKAYPFHKHHVLDELFFIVSGDGEYRFGAERYTVTAGDLIGAPAGAEAHQLINTGTEDLRCIALSSGGGADIVEYPDSGKLSMAAGIKNSDFHTATIAGMGRLQKTDYWDGE